MSASSTTILKNFRRNRIAVAAAAFLGFMTVIAALAPYLQPETYQGFDYRRGSAHPGLTWRYLLGADVFGHSILTFVIGGARTTLGIAYGSAALGLLLGMAGAVIAVHSGRFGRTICGLVSDIIGTVPMFPLIAILVVYTGVSTPARMIVIFGLVASPFVMKVLVGKDLFTTGLGSGGRAVLPRPPSASFQNLLPAAVRASTAMLVTFAALGVTLDYFGWGLADGNLSWGLGLKYWYAYLDSGLWWWLVFPGTVLTLTLLSINLTGKGLADAIEQARRPALWDSQFDSRSRPVARDVTSA